MEKKDVGSHRHHFSCSFSFSLSADGNCEKNNVTVAKIKKKLTENDKCERGGEIHIGGK